jgi:hypothetical protein
MQTYTIDQLYAAWKEYEDTTVMEVLREGRWKIIKNHNQNKPIDGTSARRTKISNVMDFPDFLKDVWKPKA